MRMISCIRAPPRFTLKCPGGDADVDRCVAAANDRGVEFFSRNLVGDTVSVVHKSAAGVIFRGRHPAGMSVIFKIYHDTPRALHQARSELCAYGAVGDLCGVPHLWDVLDGDGLVVLCMQDCSVDTFDLMGTAVDTGAWWLKGVSQMARLLAQMHARGVFHGDIKMENMAWDGSQFYMLDFGFTVLDNKIRVCGTVPHLPPAIMEVQFDRLPRPELDYYAFAVSFLTLFDFPIEERCSTCVDLPRSCGKCNFECSVIDIETLSLNRVRDVPVIPPYKSRWSKDFFYQNPTAVLVYHALCDIVLAAVDTSRRRLVWKKAETTCYYTGANKIILPPPRPMCESWAAILAYIS